MKKFVIAIVVVVMAAAFAVPAFAAMNPFMDVPASHWAYDAIAQLAARGVISGYPDGAYKGAQPATRYEMASALARALAKVDMEKAGKQDVETLKKLIVEFKDELDVLGVKVDKLDERVAVLERDLGGWSLAGELRFDAYVGDGIDGEEADFNLNRYRLYIRKRVNETTNFTARLGNVDNSFGDSGIDWELYYITAKLGYDITMTVGHQEFDWEEQLGLYVGDDAYVGDWRGDLFGFRKDWGIANLELIVGREEDGDKGSWGSTLPAGGPDMRQIEQYLIAGLVNFDVSEKFRVGVMAYYWLTDDDFGLPAFSDYDLLDLGFYAGYRFTPAIELKGVYYHQDQGDAWGQELFEESGIREDTAAAWKVILDVDQEVLKFTSLWLEYGQIDNNFARFNNGTHTDFDSDTYGRALLGNRPFQVNDHTAKLYGVRTDQRWNDKWRTFASYFVAEFDTAGYDDTTDLTVGIAYRLNPAVELEFSYDWLDYGSCVGQPYTCDEGVFRFRTFVTF